MLLGIHLQAGGTHYDYGTHTLYGEGLNLLRLYARTSTPRTGRSSTRCPTTPATQPLPGITRNRFSPIRFRSPLLTESLHCFLFLSVLRCFTSDVPSNRSIHSTGGHTPQQHAGFPHSEILVSTLGYQLHQAYRRFPRPSSAPTTKAFTMRPKTLTTIITVAAMTLTTLSARLKIDTKNTDHTTRRDQHDSSTFVQLRTKMLASTMQFPNNNPHHHHQPH